jgi:hypothetical protein
LPTGAARFCERNAVTTWSIPTPSDARSVGRTFTLSCALSPPTTFTCATPPIARRSPATVCSAICVSCGGVSTFDVIASETIGS